MDSSATLSEFLLDSGTESCTDSPIPADDSEHSEDSTVCDSGSSNCVLTKCKKTLDLIDKAVSVDEDTLPTPLEPIPVDIYQQQQQQQQEKNDNINNESQLIETDDNIFDLNISDNDNNDNFPNNNNNIIIDDKKLNVPLPSILRRESYNNGCKQQSLESSSSSSTILRRVSFPSDKNELAIYREPEMDYSWMINTYLPPETILQIYQASCKQHKTIELDIIKQNIGEIKNNTDHSAILNLSMVNITNEVNETLEDLLKVTNFRKLILYECKFTSETISEFLNMLEYYESICEIEVSMNFDDIEPWKCFCSACTNIMVLESISFKGMVINDNYMRMLINAIKNNSNITTLKFDSCILVRLPSFYLVENLMTNTTLCELYLPSTGLYTLEADCLGRFLQKNLHLKVLDISNNFIGDRGLEVLAKGLTKQNTLGYGLSVLVIFNNQLTEKSGPIISSIISECKNLHTLNIGYNNLTDEVILNIKSSLEVTKSLEGLGLQCTLLTCKGINYLSEAITNNSSLEKINLKGNKAIQVGGLEQLCQALTNSKIIKIEVDETNRSCNDPQAYIQLVKKINAICTVNKSFKESTNNEINNISKLISRKVSLSCEPKYIMPEYQTNIETNTSPVLLSLQPSSQRSNSPIIKNSRFKITNVKDNQNLTQTSSLTSSSLTSSSSSSSSSTIQTKQQQKSTPSRSRFKVTKVTPSPDDDNMITSSSSSKFAFIRSSVSSNSSSVESLHTIDTDSDN